MQIPTKSPSGGATAKPASTRFSRRRPAKRPVADPTLLNDPICPFRLPPAEVQQQIAAAFRSLIRSDCLDAYFRTPLTRKDNLVYYSEIRGPYANLYVTTLALLPRLRLTMARRESHEAIAFMVLKGTCLQHGVSTEVRVGAFGVPCTVLTRVLTE